ncbi:MAG: 6-phosphogluconolactonase [Myxococcota bacterium]
MTLDNLLVCNDAASFVDTAATWIAGRIAASVAERGGCSVALSGGSTPRPVYERLAEPPHLDAIPWEAIDVYFGDERCVAPTDVTSNYRMAHEALLSRVSIPESQVHRIEAEHPDRPATARDYAALLPARLDVLILGVGGDGHTASLFPESPLLQEQTLRVAPAQSPKAPPWRLTITPRVIGEARTTVVLVQGKSKADIVAQALLGPRDPHRLPIQLAERATWIVDPAAAGSIREHGR